MIGRADHATDSGASLGKMPVAPLRLHISSGQFMALVARSLVAIGVSGPDGPVDRLAHHDLSHVVKTEPVDGHAVDANPPP